MPSPRRRIPILHLARRNAGRHVRRTVLTATAVAVAVAGLVLGLALVGGVLDNLRDTFARIEAGHVRIRTAEYGAREQFLPVHLSLSGVGKLLSAIRSQAGVEAALPRIRASVLVDREGANRPALLLGLDMEGESRYLAPATLTALGQPPRAGQREMVIGEGLARKLGAGIGDTLTLLAQTAYRSLGGIRLTVTGLMRSGVAFLDDGVMLAPLDQAQQLLDLPDGATEIVVFGSDPEGADPLARALEAGLAPLAASSLDVLPWSKQGSLMSMLQTARSAYSVMLLLLLLMAGLVIVNTMLMTVVERTREFGMQAALGMRPRDIVRLVLAEGIVIGLAGALVGDMLGSVAAIVLGRTGIDVRTAARTVSLPFQGMVYPDWSVGQALLAGGLGIATAAVATLYPAWRTTRLDPAEALRR